MAATPFHYSRLRYLGTCVAIFGSIALLEGCGDGGGVNVRGTVTYREKPIEGGIFFFPKEGQPIVAALDSEGKYLIQLPPGDYRVIVNKKDPPPAGWKEGDPPPQPTDALPDRYTEQATTVLTATVSENEQKPINFELQ